MCSCRDQACRRSSLCGSNTRVRADTAFSIPLLRPQPPNIAFLITNVLPSNIFFPSFHFHRWIRWNSRSFAQAGTIEVLRSQPADLRLTLKRLRNWVKSNWGYDHNATHRKARSTSTTQFPIGIECGFRISTPASTRMEFHRIDTRRTLFLFWFTLCAESMVERVGPRPGRHRNLGRHNYHPSTFQRPASTKLESEP